MKGLDEILDQIEGIEKERKANSVTQEDLAALKIASILGIDTSEYIDEKAFKEEHKYKEKF